MLAKIIFTWICKIITCNTFLICMQLYKESMPSRKACPVANHADTSDIYQADRTHHRYVETGVIYKRHVGYLSCGKIVL